MESGELCLPADARVVGRQLLGAYLSAYAPAFQSTLSPEDLRAAQVAQARALLAGYAANCSARQQAA